MKLKPLLVPLALAGAAGLAAQPALAGGSGYPVQTPPPNGYYAGTLIIRGGAAFVDPDNDVFRGRQIFDADVTLTEPVTVGTRVDLDDDTTWFISGTYIFADHFAVELYHANSASLDATLYSDAFFTNTGEFIGEFRDGLGDFDTNITSVFFDWFFLDPSCLVQPYVGIGVSYTDIEEDFRRAVFRTAATPDMPAMRFGKIGFGSDFSWTAQIGADFRFGHDSNWLVNVSAMYVDSEPDFSLGFDTETFTGLTEPVFLPVRVRSNLDIDPWVFNLGIGYKFSF